MKIIVVPHDPGWAAKFLRESALVKLALGPGVVEIHHIGSTAISTIYAKPIVDMLAVVRTIDEVDGRNEAMAALGYEAMGELGIPGRRYFRKDDASGMREYQVHTFAADSGEIERHLAFRDFIRAHAEPARQYSDLKRRLAEQFPEDIEGYMAGKDAFVKEMQHRALAWRATKPTSR